MNGLRNKTTIVTGAAAPRSIGRTTALRLAAEGVNLVLNDVNADQLQAVVDEINAAGGKAVAVIGDVSQAATAEKLVETAIQTFGSCDILINNAGVTESLSIADLTEDRWDRLLTINLKSIYLCTRAALVPMTQQKYGRIVNMSSMGARNGGSFGSAHYAASKAGIIGFTRSVAREAGPNGITVNAVAPGSIDTDILKNKPSKDGRTPEEVMADRLSRTPLRRLALADEVASTIVFLASDEASFITGAVLDVNGGAFMG